MCEWRPAREIGQSCRAVKCRLTSLIHRLRTLTPADDPIGVAIRVIIRRTDRRKETREQNLRSCVETNPRRLRRIIHRDMGPSQPENKLPPCWALCVFVFVFVIIFIFVFVLRNSEP